MQETSSNAGVMGDRNIQTQLKDKVYQTVIKPAMVYGRECWAVRQKGGEEIAHNHARVRGKTRLNHVRNMAEFLREKRLIWFGHAKRRDKDDATRNILQTSRSFTRCREST